jgi:hypothetical protein
MIKDRRFRHAAAVLSVAAVFVVLVGCGSTNPGSEVPPFRQAVVTADQQTSSAFADVNRFLRGQQIEHALTQPTLNEDLFFEALPSEDLAKWSRAFSLIDSYGEKLELLLGEGQRSGVEGELSVLGQKIQEVDGDQLPAGISAAFTRFGGLLVQLKAERDAHKAIRKADPAIQQVFSAMMEAIGEDAGSGVRGTVRVAWAQILARISVEYLRDSSQSARRLVVGRYVEALDERDAEDRVLGSLRLSLASLAKAHEELAYDRSGSAGALLQLIQDEYKGYREELKAIRERRGADSTNGGTQ